MLGPSNRSRLVERTRYKLKPRKNEVTRNILPNATTFEIESRYWQWELP
jgi:hypothetical protein